MNPRIEFVDTDRASRKIQEGTRLQFIYVGVGTRVIVEMDNGTFKAPWMQDTWVKDSEESKRRHALLAAQAE